MTNEKTICECGHTWEIHHKIDWQTKDDGEVMGCLHPDQDGDLCPCEKFIKAELKSMEYEEKMSKIKFETTDQISLSRNDIIYIAKENNLQLTEDQIDQVLTQSIKDLNSEVEKISDKWNEFVIKAIEEKLRIEVVN